MRTTASILVLEGNAESVGHEETAAGMAAGPDTPPAAPVPIGPDRERIATVAQIFWIVAATIGLCYFARAVILPLVLAWVAGMVLKPPVRWLRDRKFPAPVAAALVLAVFLVPIGIGVSQLGRPAVEWIREAPGNAVILKTRLGHFFRPAHGREVAAGSTGVPGPAAGDAVPAVDLSDGRVATAVFSWTGGMLALCGEFVGLLFLLLTSGDAFLAKLVKVLPTLHDKRRVVGISHEIQQSISTYLFSVTLVNVVFGAVAALVFSLTGLPHATMWGAIAGALNFIPYFGPVIGIVAVGMGGLLAFDTIGAGLVPMICYLVIHLIEANAITPMVLGRRFTLNPVVIFVMLIFFVWLWGVPGAFVAVPLLVSAKVICERVHAFQPIAEFLAR